jgi:hypothetical protein
MMRTKKESENNVCILYNVSVGQERDGWMESLSALFVKLKVPFVVCALILINEA